MSAGPVLQPGDSCTNCGKGTVTRAAPLFEPGGGSSILEPDITTGRRTGTEYDCTHCGAWREAFPPPPAAGDKPGGSRLA